MFNHILFAYRMTGRCQTDSLLKVKADLIKHEIGHEWFVKDCPFCHKSHLFIAGRIGSVGNDKPEYYLGDVRPDCHFQTYRIGDRENNDFSDTQEDMNILGERMREGMNGEQRRSCGRQM